MAEVVRDPDGNLWEERKGKWYPVESVRAGGMMAGADLGQVGGFGVAAGEKLAEFGAGIHKLIATGLGDKEWAKRIDAERAEQKARYGGAEVTGPGAAMLAGSLAPSLALLPIGLGVGAAGLGARIAASGLPLAGRVGAMVGETGATRGLPALAEQVMLGGGMAGMQHSGDQGMDAMVGALLGAGGWGTGQLAGKVMGAIHQRGVVARMAAMDALDAQAGVGPPVRGGAGMGGIEGPPAPPGMSGTGGGVESAEDVLRFGAATRPGAEALIEGRGLPGQMAGAPGLTREEARQLARFDELGFEVTPGTRTGSLPQKQIEAGLQRSPVTAGAFEGMFKRNRDRLNGYAVRAIGEDGTELAPSVLDAAHSRIGRVFDAAGELMGTMRSGDEVVKEASTRLRGIVAEASEGAAVVPEVGAAAGRLMGIWEDAGQVSGERLMRERSRLVKLARGYSNKGDGLASDGIHDVIAVIDDMVADAVPASGRQALREVRAQWRVLRTLEGGGVIDAAGNVRSGALFQGMTREFPMEMRRGVGATSFGATNTGGRARDLMDAVRGAQTFRQAIPDSGTATGMAMQGLQGNLLERVLGGALTHTAGRLYLGGGGRLGSELAAAQNVAPGVTGGVGGAGRGLLGLMGGF